MTDPLFRSAYEALIFAYNYSGQQYARTPMSKIAAPVASGKGLCGTDGAAQAGMIRSEVASLGKLHEAAVIARCAPVSSPCSCGRDCCSRKKKNREWTNAINILEQHLEKDVLSNCYTTFDMRIQYLTKFYCSKADQVSFYAISCNNDVCTKTVKNHFSIVKNSLFGKSGIETIAMSRLESRFSDLGLVG